MYTKPKQMKKLLLLVAIVSIAFVACSKLNNGPAPHRDRLIGFILGTDTLDMYVGQVRYVPITINPSDYHKDSLKWKSSDTSVILIDTAGKLTAKKVGVTTISVSNLTNTISVSAVVTVSPAPVDSLKVGLIAYYPFNNNTSDLSGHSHDGIASNLVSTTDRNGKPNAAYYFDGSSSIIRVPDAAELRLSGIDFTINSWIKLGSYNMSYGSIVIDKREATSQSGWEFGVAGYGDLTNYVNNYAIATYSVSGGNDPYIAGQTRMDTVSWHMMTLVYKVGEQTATIYIDGKLDNSVTNIPTPNPNISSDMYIGADNPNNWTGYFVKGKLDDIRIYNRAVKASEVQKLYGLTN